MLRRRIECEQHARTFGHSEKVMSIIKDILVEWRVTIFE